MKYGIHIPNFGAFGTADIMAKLAKDAEDAGWDGFFIWDHVARPIIYNLVDPWIALTAVAMATEKIKFGTMVTPLPRRRPQVLARETASLDVLSGGRLILGIGLGSGRPQEWDTFGEEVSMKVRAGMTDEALDILDGLWSGEPFSYEGKHYIVKESQFLPKPVSSPRIPVWVAGYYPHKAPMRRAAKWDGMFILFGDDVDRIAGLGETGQIIASHRESDAPFDMIYLDESSYTTPLEEVKSIAGEAEKAGATWWLANIDPRRYNFDWEDEWDFDLMRQTIVEGPPR